MAYQSFANLNYDKCALDKKDQENLSHFNWTTDVNYGKSNSECFVGTSPFTHNPLHAAPSEVVDLESDLRLQNYTLSRCPSMRYNPMANCTDCANCNEGLPCGCSHCVKTKIEFLKDCNDAKTMFLTPEYTRVKRPCNILSGITINRFDPLCDDIQSLNKIQDNSYIGSNTRLSVRDTFASMNKKYPNQTI